MSCLANLLIVTGDKSMSELNLQPQMDNLALPNGVNKHTARLTTAFNIPYAQSSCSCTKTKHEHELADEAERSQADIYVQVSE